MITEPVRFLNFKLLVANILTSDLVEKAISKIFNNNIPSYDLVVKIHPHFNGIKSSVFFRIYESAEIKFIRLYLKNNIDVIELGSSLGILSSHIANRLTEEYKLICVEANPSLLLNLNDNLVQNAHHLRSYEIINAVIDYRGEEYVNFFISDHNTTSSTLVETSEKHNIKTITLNRIIKDYHIGKYALVMDIEGAEFDIIKYDKKSLDQCQMIIAELHKSTSLVEGNSKDAKVKDTASVNDLIELICSYGFILSKRRDCVCLFERK